MYWEYSDTDEKSYQQYVADLRQRLREAYRAATTQAEKARVRQKKNYDKLARASVLEVGDRVLVKRLAFDGRHKIEDRWEEEPYVICKQPASDVPVYTVSKEDGTGRTRTLHRNHLLPIGSLPVDFEDDNQALTPVDDAKEDSDEEEVYLVTAEEDHAGEDTTQSVAGRAEDAQTAEVDQSDIHSDEEEAAEEIDTFNDDLDHLEDGHISDTNSTQSEISNPEVQIDEHIEEMEAIADQDITNEVVMERPVPKPRQLRTRERRPPEFWRYGEFVSHQQVVPSQASSSNLMSTKSEQPSKNLDEELFTKLPKHRQTQILKLLLD